MAHGDAREEKWRGKWRMEWVASTLHSTSERGAPIIITADAHTSAASGRLNWRPCRFKRTGPFRRKKKYVFCACAITFQTQSTKLKGFYSRITSTKSPTFCMTTTNAILTHLTVFLPQLRDYNCYVNRPILAPPPLGLQKRTDPRAHDFALSPDVWHQSRLANFTCAWDWKTLCN